MTYTTKERIWILVTGILLLGSAIALLATILRGQVTSTAVGPQCDATLWNHVYHRQRLHVQQACVSLTGTWRDATNGKTADGCRHEKDGDGHCWLNLDAGQDGVPGDGKRWQDTVRGGVIGPYLNPVNMAKQNGNLVVEPICFYKTTQPDAIPFCKSFHQAIALPPVGSHVRVTGAFVLDAEHGHMEIHPVSSITIIK